MSKEKTYYCECMDCGNDWDFEANPKDIEEILEDISCPKCGSGDIGVSDEDDRYWNGDKFESLDSRKSLLKEAIEDVKESGIFDKIKKFLVNKSSLLAKWLMSNDLKYGLKLPIKIVIEKELHGELIKGFKSAAVWNKDLGTVLGIFPEDIELENGLYKYKKLEDFSMNVDVYYFTKNSK